MKGNKHHVLVTGGAGYVGSVLVPRLLASGHRVTVFDLYIYGDDSLAGVRGSPGLREIHGDIRDQTAVRGALKGCDSIIHLACISNDPSYDLDPELGKSINHNAFLPLVRSAREMGVGRFIYASSSSVYGVNDSPDVYEDMPLAPLTDYSRYKAVCEAELERERRSGFVTCVVRPATVCGYAPRQRLDVIVNILTNHAVNTGRIRIFGGTQKRPNIHIDDMADVYTNILDQPGDMIDGEIFNAGYENHTLIELAEIVRKVVGGNVAIDVEPTDDHRSYHISSEKIGRKLGFRPARNIESAVRGLVRAFGEGKLPRSMDDPRYFNVRMMKTVRLR